MEERGGREGGAGGREGQEGGEARVRVAEDGVPVAGNYKAGGEVVFEVGC